MIPWSGSPQLPLYELKPSLVVKANIARAESINSRVLGGWSFPIRAALRYAANGNEPRYTWSLKDHLGESPKTPSHLCCLEMDKK
jgi:hypothetical protein